MIVQKVIVDEIPESCGDCFLMQYIKDQPICCALVRDDYRAELAGNPYDMDYRRSDCPLVEKALKERKQNV